MARNPANGLPKYCSYATDRHGKRRVRFRRGSHSVYITGEPWSAEFLSQYTDALEGAKATRQGVGQSRTLAGTFNDLALRYYESAAYKSLRPSTMATYRGIVERFRARFGQAKIKDFERRHFITLVGEMSDRQAAANNLLRVIRQLFDYAIDLDLIKINPVDKVKGYSRKTDGFHSWTEAEISAFEDTHPLGTKARLALALLLYTGQRRGDVVRMGPQHIRNGRIFVTQQKTGVSLQIALHPNLSEVINTTPSGSMTFLVTSHGEPYTAAGFGNWFRERCDEAGLRHCASHGLRKAAARRLAEVGLSTRQIMAVTGHTTLKEVERYTRAVDQAALADVAIQAITADFKTSKKPNNE